jgi:hypothetical protein
MYRAAWSDFAAAGAAAAGRTRRGGISRAVADADGQRPPALPASPAGQRGPVWSSPPRRPAAQPNQAQVEVPAGTDLAQGADPAATAKGEPSMRPARGAADAASANVVVPAGGAAGNRPLASSPPSAPTTRAGLPPELGLADYSQGDAARP